MKTLSLKERENWLERAELIKRLNANNEQRKQDMSDLFRLATGRPPKSRAKNDAKGVHVRFGTATSALTGEPVNPKLYKLAKYVRRKIHKK